jgi:hypothetical protein
VTTDWTQDQVVIPCLLTSAATQRVAETEITAQSMTPAVVLIPVDSEGKAMQEQVVRSTLRELGRAEQKKDWSMPYHG